MTRLACCACGLVCFADMSRSLTASTAASTLNKAMPWLPFSTVAGVALWLLLRAIAFAQTLPPVSFYAARTFATNTAGSVAPESVVVGDFNGDGHLDMAVANSEYASGNVGVLLGKGDGTFRPAVNYAAGSDPVSVAVGDFNGDDKLDLAVADNDGGVSVLLGKGDGTFQAATNYATGTAPVWVAVGDFNGDGKLDLAVADFGISGHLDSGVSVLLGKGDGTFQAAVNYPAGIEPLSIAVGDFNGDGKPDLAAAENGGVMVLLGNGDGTFQTPVGYAAGTDLKSTAVGDFNGDGHLDLVVARTGAGGGVSLLLGKGDGTFGTAVDYGAGIDPNSVAVGDFNGDGKADLAVTGGGGIGVLLGKGDGTFAKAVRYPAGSSLNSVAMGDFNGDGKPDLAVAGGGGGVSVLLGKGNGAFQSAASYSVGLSLQSVTVGDFNGDGYADLAVADYGIGGRINGSVRVMLGTASGTFGKAVKYTAGTYPLSVAIGDVNGDGKLDLAVASVSAGYATGSVSVLLGKGDGTFQSAVNYAVSTAPVSIAVGDFNGDGRPDLAVADGGGVSVLLGKGDGTFQPAENYATGTTPKSVAGGDFNGDGKADLAVATEAGVSVLLGKGDGTFRTAVTYAAGPNPYAVAVADFNGDGKMDLAVANPISHGGLSLGDGVVSVLLGNGDGTFQKAVNYAAPTFPTALAVGDFNGDGKPDLAAAGGDGVSVLLGKGDGTFQAAVNYAADNLPLSIAVGDFNRDGTPDLAVAAGVIATYGTEYGYVSVLLNTSVK